MKRIFTLIFVVIMVAFYHGANAQNLIDNWDANGASGEGTEPYLLGWAATGVGVPGTWWGQANVGSTIRLQDVTGYTYNGSPWSGRVMFIRWDGVGASNTSSVWSYPVTLEANKNYLFTGKIGWNSNGAPNTYTISINSAADNTGTFLASDTVNIPRTLFMRENSMFFTPTSSGTYYLTFKNNIAILGAVGDLSITEVADPCVSDIINQYNALSLDGLADVQSNLALPTGTGLVTINWTSSNPSVISNSGIVTRPEMFNATVILTANLTCGTYQETKSFTANVIATSPIEGLIARWDFESSKISLDGDTIKVVTTGDGVTEGIAYTGKLVNEARIRTIGTSPKFNVLDLGNSKGYFDMSKEIGQAIYSLNDYTICGYFRIDTSYKALNSNGNFLWTFANSSNVDADKIGYIIGSLKAQGQSIAAKYYNDGNQAVQVNANAPQGSWHHMAYTQEGDSGRVYIDGVIRARGLVTNKPSTTLPKPGLSGTPFNWLGRSNYPNDVYLRKSLVYDFRVLNVPLSADDMASGGYIEVENTIAALNDAFVADSNYVASELITEQNNLVLGDLSALIENITLPTTGTLDNTIKIFWKSSLPQVISSTGVVVRPNYYDANVTLTATLFKNGQTVSKSFPATVLLNPGSQFTNDLIVKYDFAPARVNGSEVTDAAEKSFKGTMMNNASIRTIGNVGEQYDVLDLGNGTGYFDMGEEVGKVLYHLNDFTIGAYFLIDTAYKELNSNGNFLWSLANSDKMATDKNGYIFGSLKTTGVDISQSNNTSQSVSQSQNATRDSRWHHIAYALEGNTAVLYLDGFPMTQSETMSLTPSTALPKEGRIGTLYNWLGRSCWASDVYLRKTLVYDFRLYKRALNPAEVESSIMNVPTTIAALNSAYVANPNMPTSIAAVKNTPYEVIAKAGKIRINGLTGKEKVAVFDFTGRRIHITNSSAIEVRKGIYIVRIDNFAKKVSAF